MGMQYLLILIISLSIIYFKYNDLTQNINYKEMFQNYKDSLGIKIIMPIKKTNTILVDSTMQSNMKIANVLKNYGNFFLKKNDKFNCILENVNDNLVDFGLTQEDIVIDSINDNNNKNFNNIRGICSLYYEYLILIINNEYTDINTLDDLLYYINNTPDKPFTIGTEKHGSLSNYYFDKIFSGNNFKTKDITNILESNENLDYNNELFYINQDKNTLLNYLNNDIVDGLFFITNNNDLSIRNLLQNKKVKFIPTSYINSINDVFFKGLYNKKLNTGLFYDSLIEGDIVDVKASRVLAIANKNIENKKVYNFIKELFETHLVMKKEMSKIENSNFMNIGYKEDFIPIEMSYINKNIKYHDGAHKYLVDIGFITKINNSKCKELAGKTKCVLDDEDINKEQYYWKYNQIGLKKFDLEKYN